MASDSARGKSEGILVTGAAGFLGSHLVAELVCRGYTNVYAGIRGSSDQWRLNALDTDGIAKRVLMDLNDGEAIGSLLGQCRPKIVVNCAAYGVEPAQIDSSLIFSTNLEGVYRLLESSAKNNVERFIQIGSCFEYGDKKIPISEDAVLQPTTMYGASKAAASLILESRARDLELPLSIFRVFGLWGALEAPYRLVPQILDACHNKKPLKLTGGEQVRDYSYVRDVACSIADLLFRKGLSEFEMLNVGSGKAVVLKDFILDLANVMGGQELMKFSELPYRESEMWHLVADISKLEGLGMSIYNTSIKRGVEEMMRYQH